MKLRQKENKKEKRGKVLVLLPKAYSVTLSSVSTLSCISETTLVLSSHIPLRSMVYTTISRITCLLGQVLQLL